MDLLMYGSTISFDSDRDTVINRLKTAVEQKSIQSYGFLLIGEVGSDSFKLLMVQSLRDYESEMLSQVSKIDMIRDGAFLGWLCEGSVITEKERTVVHLHIKGNRFRYIWYFVPILCSLVTWATLSVLPAFSSATGCITYLLNINRIWLLFSAFWALVGFLKPLIFRVYCRLFRIVVSDAIEYTGR